MLGLFKFVFNLFNPNYINYCNSNAFKYEFDYHWLIKQKDYNDFISKVSKLEYSEQIQLISAINTRYEKQAAPYDNWDSETEDHYIVHLLKGCHLITRAWYFRGGGTADTVDDDSAMNFIHCLNEASNCLLEASDLPDANGHAYANLIAVGLGHSDELPVLLDHVFNMRAKDKAAGLVPNLEGHRLYLNASCEKWLGSHDQMFEFARQYSSIDAGHGYMSCLLCHAHLQMWLYHKVFEQDDEAADSYFDQSNVKEELATAHHWFMDNYDDTATGFNLTAHNMFAGLLQWSNQHDLAPIHFEKMGKQALEDPWGFIGIKKLNEGRKKYLK